MIDPAPYWPAEKPGVPPDPHGWMLPQNAQLLSENLDQDTKVVVELGSWLGQSTRHMLNAAPNATVIAIDHWLGGSDHQGPNGICHEKLPTLYETFLVNCWDYRDRLIPIRKPTIEGMTFVAEQGVKADLVYVDADHMYESVKADINMALDLWPDAKILGDDFSWGVEYNLPIKRAVEEVAAERNMSYEVRLTWAWALRRRTDA